MFKYFILPAAFITTSMFSLNTPVYADDSSLIGKHLNQSTTFKIAQSTTYKVAPKIKTKRYQKVKVTRDRRLKKRKIVPGLSFKFARSMKTRLEAIQWTMVAGSKGRPILSGNRYQLKNSIPGRGLRRKRRTIAANLGWQIAKSKSFTVRIKRKKGNGQVRYGDVVALELKSYGWLRYKKQRRGINLSNDSRKPRYVWIVRGGTRGTKLVSDMPFALYFTKYRTEMTYCKRTWGIDLGWYRKSKCGGWKANLSNRVFGANGLYSRDGLTGKAFVILRDNLCEKAIAAAGAAIVGYTGASAAPAVAAGAPYAIKQCKKI